MRRKEISSRSVREAWHSCGLRTDGTAICWGDNGSGQADAPEGDFRQISADLSHSCGLRTDGVIVCWGSNEFGRRMRRQVGLASSAWARNTAADLGAMAALFVGVGMTSVKRTRRRG